MKINIKKTKMMCMTEGKKTRQMKIRVKGIIKEFRYLGSVIADDTKCHKEIKRRIV